MKKVQSVREQSAATETKRQDKECTGKTGLLLETLVMKDDSDKRDDEPHAVCLCQIFWLETPISSLNEALTPTRKQFQTSTPPVRSTIVARSSNTQPWDCLQLRHSTGIGVTTQPCEGLHPYGSTLTKQLTTRVFRSREGHGTLTDTTRPICEAPGCISVVTIVALKFFSNTLY